MKLKRLWINGFKNLNDFEINFESNDGITLLIGNNGSGKSNILEAISAIFVGLFKNSTPQKRPDFEYEIEYVLDGKKIFIENKKVTLRSDVQEYLYKFKIDDIEKQKNQFLQNFDYLPSHIIASYSGEESRLWDLYYEKFYKDYIKNAITPRGGANHLKMIYVNKYHWKIAFLLLAVYNTGNNNFIKDILKIDSVESISFKFNVTKFSSFSNQNGELLRLARSLTPDNLPNVTYTNLNDIKTIFENFGHERDLFLLLVGAFLPVRDANKLILDIDIKFKKSNILLDVNCLSEGEKKLILVKLILEYLSFEKALILLDEPDSHIHIQNKKVFKELIASYENRFSILTTHSPTLTHSFEDKHISMINNGKIEDKQKQEIFSYITDGIWNYQEQSVFLSSPHKIDLIVEGKFDKIHIETAIKSDKLGSDFPDLKFGVFDLKSCDNMKKMFDGLCNADNLHIPNKKIIFIFDNEKQFFNGQNLAGKEFQNAVNIKNNLYKKKGIYLLFLPKKIDFIENFTIENMYPSEKFANCLQETLTKRLSDNDYFNNFIDYITDGIKEDAKKLLSEKCIAYTKGDFLHFEELFKLIQDVKNDGN